MEAGKRTLLVHLASGIGNIVLATPLLAALHQLHFTVDLLLDADYPQTSDLLRDWSIVRQVFSDHSNLTRSNYDFIVPAIPPFYWPRFSGFYKNDSRIIRRPPDSLFYQDEQEYYLRFARKLGYPVNLRPFYRLPVYPSEAFGVTRQTLVISPGCKTGEMAAKRWPYFPQLAEAFEDVVIVGTADDMCQRDGTLFQFPAHARSFVGKLTLRETAELLAAAGIVVGNDAGLSHIAAAAGTPTVMIFGPTPDLSLGQFPPNVKVLRTNLACEPCWFGARLHACSAQINCLRQLKVEVVEQEVRAILGF
jgi:ADP-heptose:LPS heptosyltransferase